MIKAIMAGTMFGFAGAGLWFLLHGLIWWLLGIPHNPFLCPW